MRAIVSNQIRRVRWFGVVFSLAAVGAVPASAIAGAGDHGLQAQQPVPAPSFPPIVFNGNVTINGETPEYTGFQITARIGDQWESPPVVVGADPENPFRYQHLVVAPPLDLDLIGSQIEFWLDGDVKSTVTNWYAVVDEFSGEVCTECLWSFPLLRQLDLDFPVLPNATPTTEPAPDPTPTPSDDLEPPPIPLGFPDLVFRGSVTINGEPLAESGFKITARIGSLWESTPVRVRRVPQRPYEYSQLSVQPPLDRDLAGAEIEFWLEGKVKADTTSVFAPYDPGNGVYCALCPWTFPELRTLNLNFPHHPDQPPSPTPLPTPTATGQPLAPQYPVFILHGHVTINGQEPARSGFEVTARIRDVWQSHPVVVGSDSSKPFEYEYLIIAPDRQLKLIGSHIEFWIAGQVRSRTKSVFAFLPGESCDGCETYSTLPVLRQVDLDFPRLPDLMPTPSPTALPTSTNTPTPSPSPSATPTMTPTLTPVPPTQMPEPTNTPSPTPSPIPHTATPEPTSTFTSTPTAQPPTATATITPPPIPPPTSTPTPTSSPMPPTPYPTVVPTSTSTPTPTSVPAITTVTISPPIPTPATVESDARMNAITGLAVTAILTVLAALGYIRWCLRRRSSI